MAEIMGQQRLLLEWLVMAGNIAVSDTDNGTTLFATQVECEKAGWIKLTQFGSGFFMAAITDSGKDVVKNRRTGGNRQGSASDRKDKSTDRRRSATSA